MAFFPMPDYCPDLMVTNGNYTNYVKNVLPAPDGYSPLPDFLTLPTNLATAYKNEIGVGVFVTQDLRGQVYTFLGTKRNIFLLSGQYPEWHCVSKTSNCYNLSLTSRWSFAHFGDFVIAVNNNDPPQVFCLKSGQKFTDLKGNPPRAGLVKIWGDFVCLLQLSEHPNRIHWSGLNRLDCWSPGEHYCDYQEFSDAGKVQYTSEEAHPIVILEHAIYKATFLPGSGVVFSFKKIHSACGATDANLCASRGEYSFFLYKQKFYQITSDGELTPIGFGKVDKSFAKFFRKTPAQTLQCVVDPVESRVYWGFSHCHSNLKIGVYDWLLERWSFLSQPKGILFAGGVPGENLKTIEKKGYSQLEEIPYSFDDRFLNDVTYSFGLLTEKEHHLCYYSSQDPQEGEILTAPICNEGGGGLRLRQFVPKIDGSCEIEFINESDGEPLSASKPLYSYRYHTQKMTIFSVRAQAFRIKFLFKKYPKEKSWSRVSGFTLTLTPSGRQ